MFSDYGVFTLNENCRPVVPIVLEEYVKLVNIESPGYLNTNHILPAALEYQHSLINNVKGWKNLGLEEPSYVVQLNLLKVTSSHIQATNDKVEAMIAERKS
ncbi:MAG: hypothetical protein JNM21_07625 [Taibaiella sp.]|nr:hypothetical protein [Taibaiella sp.]